MINSDDYLNDIGLGVFADQNFIEDTIRNPVYQPPENKNIITHDELMQTPIEDMSAYDKKIINAETSLKDKIELAKEVVNKKGVVFDRDQETGEIINIEHGFDKTGNFTFGDADSGNLQTEDGQVEQVRTDIVNSKKHLIDDESPVQNYDNPNISFDAVDKDKAIANSHNKQSYQPQWYANILGKPYHLTTEQERNNVYYWSNWLAVQHAQDTKDKPYQFKPYNPSVDYSMLYKNMDKSVPVRYRVIGYDPTYNRKIVELAHAETGKRITLSQALDPRLNLTFNYFELAKFAQKQGLVSDLRESFNKEIDHYYRDYIEGIGNKTNNPIGRVLNNLAVAFYHSWATVVDSSLGDALSYIGVDKEYWSRYAGEIGRMNLAMKEGVPIEYAQDMNYAITSMRNGNYGEGISRMAPYLAYLITDSIPQEIEIGLGYWGISKLMQIMPNAFTQTSGRILERFLGTKLAQGTQATASFLTKSFLGAGVFAAVEQTMRDAQIYEENNGVAMDWSKWFDAYSKNVFGLGLETALEVKLVYEPLRQFFRKTSTVPIGNRLLTRATVGTTGLSQLAKSALWEGLPELPQEYIQGAISDYNTTMPSENPSLLANLQDWRRHLPEGIVGLYAGLGQGGIVGGVGAGVRGVINAREPISTTTLTGNVASENDTNEVIEHFEQSFNNLDWSTIEQSEKNSIIDNAIDNYVEKLRINPNQDLSQTIPQLFGHIVNYAMSYSDENEQQSKLEEKTNRVFDILNKNINNYGAYDNFDQIGRQLLFPFIAYLSISDKLSFESLSNQEKKVLIKMQEIIAKKAEEFDDGKNKYLYRTRSSKEEFAGHGDRNTETDLSTMAAVARELMNLSASIRKVYKNDKSSDKLKTSTAETVEKMHGIFKNKLKQIEKVTTNLLSKLQEDIASGKKIRQIKEHITFGQKENHFFYFNTYGLINSDVAKSGQREFIRHILQEFKDFRDIYRNILKKEEKGGSVIIDDTINNVENNLAQFEKIAQERNTITSSQSVDDNADNNENDNVEDNKSSEVQNMENEETSSNTQNTNNETDENNKEPKTKQEAVDKLYEYSKLINNMIGDVEGIDFDSYAYLLTDSLQDMVNSLINTASSWMNKFNITKDDIKNHTGNNISKEDTTFLLSIINSSQGIKTIEERIAVHYGELASNLVSLNGTIFNSLKELKDVITNIEFYIKQVINNKHFEELDYDRNKLRQEIHDKLAFVNVRDKHGWSKRVVDQITEAQLHYKTLKRSDLIKLAKAYHKAYAIIVQLYLYRDQITPLLYLTPENRVFLSLVSDSDMHALNFVKERIDTALNNVLSVSLQDIHNFERMTQHQISGNRIPMAYTDLVEAQRSSMYNNEDENSDVKVEQIIDFGEENSYRLQTQKEQLDTTNGKIVQAGNKTYNITVANLRILQGKTKVDNQEHLLNNPEFEALRYEYLHKNRMSTHLDSTKIWVKPAIQDFQSKTTKEYNFEEFSSKFNVDKTEDLLTLKRLSYIYDIIFDKDAKKVTVKIKDDIIPFIFTALYEYKESKIYSRRHSPLTENDAQIAYDDNEDNTESHYLTAVKDHGVPIKNVAYDLGSLIAQHLGLVVSNKGTENFADDFYSTLGKIALDYAIKPNMVGYTNGSTISIAESLFEYDSVDVFMYDGKYHDFDSQGNQKTNIIPTVRVNQNLENQTIDLRYKTNDNKVIGKVKAELSKLPKQGTYVVGDFETAGLLVDEKQSDGKIVKKVSNIVNSTTQEIVKGSFRKVKNGKLTNEVYEFYLEPPSTHGLVETLDGKPNPLIQQLNDARNNKDGKKVVSKKDAIEGLYDFMQDSNVILGHNYKKFDKPLFNKFVNDDSLDQSTKDKVKEIDNKTIVDSLEISSELKGRQQGWNKLTNLYNEFVPVQEQKDMQSNNSVAHDSSFDVVMTFAITQKMDELVNSQLRMNAIFNTDVKKAVRQTYFSLIQDYSIALPLTKVLGGVNEVEGLDIHISKKGVIFFDENPLNNEPIRHTFGLRKQGKAEKEILNMLYRQAWTIAPVKLEYLKNNVFDSSEHILQLKKSLGYKDTLEMQYMTYDEQESQRGINDDIDREVRGLHAIVKAVDSGYDVHFAWFQGRNGRYFMDGACANPQNKKLLQRFLVTADNGKSNIKLKDERDLGLFYNVMFTLDALKLTDDVQEDIYRNVIELIANKDKIYEGLNYAVTSEEKLNSWIQTNIHKDANVENRGALLNLLFFLKECSEKFSDNYKTAPEYLRKYDAIISATFKNITTKLFTEIDAISSGSSLGMINFWDEKQLMEKGKVAGISLDGGSTNLDTYTIVGEEFRKNYLESGKYKTSDGTIITTPYSNLVKTANSTRETSNNPVYKIIPTHHFNFDKEITIPFIEALNFSDPKSLRDTIKYPILIKNYTGGVRTVSLRLGNELFKDFISSFIKYKKGEALSDIEQKKANFIVKLTELYFDGEDVFYSQIQSKSVRDIITNQRKLQGNFSFRKVFQDIVYASFGKALYDEIGNIYNFKDTNSMMINATKYTSNVFIKAYNSKYRELENKYGKNAIPLFELKQMREELEEYIPVIPSMFAEMQSPLMLLEENFKSMDNESIVTSFEKDNSNIPAFRTYWQEVRNGGAVIGTHNQDTMIMLSTLQAYPYLLNIFDAFIAPYDKVQEIAKMYNTRFIQINYLNNLLEQHLKMLKNAIQLESKLTGVPINQIVIPIAHANGEYLGDAEKHVVPASELIQHIQDKVNIIKETHKKLFGYWDNKENKNVFGTATGFIDNMSGGKLLDTKIPLAEALFLNKDFEYQAEAQLENYLKDAMLGKLTLHNINTSQINNALNDNLSNIQTNKPIDEKTSSKNQFIGLLDDLIEKDKNDNAFFDEKHANILQNFFNALPEEAFTNLNVETQENGYVNNGTFSILDNLISLNIFSKSSWSKLTAEQRRKFNPYRYMTASDTFVHETTHPFTYFALEHANEFPEGRVLVDRLKNVWNFTRNELQKKYNNNGYKVFLPSNFDMLSVEDKKQYEKFAKSSFDYLFNELSTSDMIIRLSEFSSYTISDSIFAKATQDLQYKQEKPYVSLFDKIVNIVYSIYELIFKNKRFKDVFTHINNVLTGQEAFRQGDTVYDEVFQITIAMAKARANALGKVKTNPVTHMYNILTDAFETKSNELLNKLKTQAFNVNPDEYVKDGILVQSTTDPRDYFLNPKILYAVFSGIDNQTKKQLTKPERLAYTAKLAWFLVRSHEAREFTLVWLKALTVKNETISAAINDLTGNTNIGNITDLYASNRIIEQSAKVVESVVFEELSNNLPNLTKEQDESLYRIGLEADLSTLIEIDSNNKIGSISIKDIKKLVSNQAIRDKYIKSLRAKILQFLIPEQYQSFDNDVELLVDFMATGKATLDTHTNVSNILSQYIMNFSEDTKIALDRLVTLKYIDKYAKQKYINNFNAIPDNGLSAFLYSHRAYKQDAKNNNINNINEIKGYTKLIDDGLATIEIGWLKNHNWYVNHDYMLIGKLQGEAGKVLGIYKRAYPTPSTITNSSLAIQGENTLIKSINDAPLEMLGLKPVDNNKESINKMLESYKEGLNKKREDFHKLKMSKKLTQNDIDQYKSDFIAQETSNGTVIDWYITLSKDVKEEHLQIPIEGVRTLSVMHGNLLRKNKSSDHNEMAWQFYQDYYNENADNPNAKTAYLKNFYEKNSKDLKNVLIGNKPFEQSIRFVDISSDSDSEYVRERYNTLPLSWRHKIEKDNEIMRIREDWLLYLFGTKNRSIVDKSDFIQNNFSTEMKMATIYAEQTMKTVAQFAKQRILFCTPSILISNFLSNIASSILFGNNIVDIAKQYKNAWRNLKAYMDVSLELAQLENKVKSRKNDNYTPEELKQKHLLELSLQSNPVYELKNEGILTTIIQEIESTSLKEDTGFIKHKFIDLNVVKKTPDVVKSVLKTAYMAEGTAMYRFMYKLTEYSDTIAKIADITMGTENLKKQNLSTDEYAKARKNLINKVKQRYVNYQIPLSSFEDYLSRTGLQSFATFRKRIQAVALNGIGMNPLRALILWGIYANATSAESPIQETALLLNIPYLKNLYMPWTLFNKAITPGMWSFFTGF